MSDADDDSKAADSIPPETTAAPLGDAGQADAPPAEPNLASGADTAVPEVPSASTPAPTVPVTPAAPPSPAPEAAPAPVLEAAAPEAEAVPAAPLPTAATATATPAAEAAGPEPELDDDDDEWDETAARDIQATRWVSMVTTVGIGIVAVVGLQVLMSLIEGLTLEAGQRFSTAEVQVPDDLLHRLGYPFGGLGATAQLFLVAGVVLISLPPVLGGRLTAGQYRATGIALRLATALAIIVAIGSLLAVRGSLHEYTAKDVAVPAFVRVQFTTFLLGTLAAAALAIFCSMAAHPLRDWDR